jgi:hypothetical protein
MSVIVNNEQHLRTKYQNGQNTAKNSHNNQQEASYIHKNDAGYAAYLGSEIGQQEVGKMATIVKFVVCGFVQK